MSDFAFIHQETKLGQILVLKDYDSITDEFKISTKFQADNEGILVEATLRIKNEETAETIFNGLKDLDNVYSFIKEVTPLKILTP